MKYLKAFFAWIARLFKRPDALRPMDRIQGHTHTSTYPKAADAEPVNWAPRSRKHHYYARHNCRKTWYGRHIGPLFMKGRAYEDNTHPQNPNRHVRRAMRASARRAA